MPIRTLHHVTATEAHAAGERIADRRRICDDPDLHLLSDEPLEMVEYVAERQRIPTEVLAADVLDALLLLEYVRRAVPAIPRVLDRLERRLLVGGAEVGLTYQQMAKPLGLRSKQAVEHRIRRQASAERGGRRDERADRLFRRAEAAQAAWVARHAAALLVATAAVVAGRDRFVAAGLEDDVDQIAESAAMIFPTEQAGDARHLEAIRRLAARLRRLAADVEDWERCARPGTVGELTSLADMMAPIRALVADHQRTLGLGPSAFRGLPPCHPAAMREDPRRRTTVGSRVGPLALAVGQRRAGGDRVHVVVR
jgi:hypothetical protein